MAQISDKDIPPIADSHCSGRVEAQPSAYSTYPGGGNICCALQSFSLGYQNFPIYDSLLQQSLRLQFLHWVAYKRALDQNIPIRERLSCPLLWCRCSFDEHAKLIDHIATCSYLLEGEYWCVSCCRAERFASSTAAKVSTNKQVRKLSRKHILNKAVQALRRLGSKAMHNTVYTTHPSSPQESQFPIPVQELEDNRYVAELTGQQFQYPMAELLASTHLKQPTTLEDDGPAELYGFSSQFELGEGTPIAEMGSDMTTDRYMQPIDERDPLPGATLSPVSPASPIYQWSGYRGPDLINPVSPFSDEHGLVAELQGTPSVIFTSEGPQTYYGPVINEEQEPMYSKVQSDSEQSLPLFVAAGPHTSFGYGLPREGLRELSSDTPTASPSSPESLVGDLLDVFEVQHADSIARMCLPPMSVSASMMINTIAGWSAKTHLELGLRAFGKMLQGSLDVGPWDVLGFSFLIVAVTTLLDREDLLLSGAVYADILDQCRATTNGPSKFMVMSLLEELWSPISQSSLLHELSSENHMSFQVGQPGKRSAAHNCGPNGANILPGGFQNGIAMQLCLQYFDSIKASSLYSDNLDSWYLRYPQHPEQCSPSMVEFAWVITNCITRPLREYTGLEGFIPVVDEVQMGLNMQKLMDLNDVKIALIRHGRAYTKSKRLLETFVQLVTWLCDQASPMLGYPPITRDQYYLHIINQTINSLDALQQTTHISVVDNTQLQSAPVYATDQSLHGSRLFDMSPKADFACPMPSVLGPTTPLGYSSPSVEGVSPDPTSYHLNRLRGSLPDISGLAMEPQDSLSSFGSLSSTILTPSSSTQTSPLSNANVGTLVKLYGCHLISNDTSATPTPRQQLRRDTIAPFEDVPRAIVGMTTALIMSERDTAGLDALVYNMDTEDTESCILQAEDSMSQLYLDAGGAMWWKPPALGYRYLPHLPA